jgi:hypothetical protein
VFEGSGVTIAGANSFPYGVGYTALNVAYANSSPKAGTYTRSATGNNAGNWSKQP